MKQVIPLPVNIFSSEKISNISSKKGKYENDSKTLLILNLKLIMYTGF